MPPRTRNRERTVTQGFSGAETPEASDETRKSGGPWTRTALEVRMVRTLTARVSLRRASGSTPCRDSTSRRSTGGRQRALTEVEKGEETPPFPYRPGGTRTLR
ncbi:hypothetical protein NDU88_002851 [Pleurodeles waltl]|uniref:Uncharacterized protein n=1 Tax=Pleurodeles waltl TaxID=8319 RepID=A0AAV7TMD2_PLEWA|nr:hypothetical protein NDU88_002851 [Pleurodeles waltl]